MSLITEPTTDPLGSVALAIAIETDRRYFELGALVEEIEGSRLAWLPGLTGAPAAVVVHRVEPAVIGDGADRWLDAVEGRLRALGAPLARIYLDERGTTLDETLARRGYVARDELALVGPTVDADIGATTLRKVVDEDDWAAKRAFHAAADVRPDGHDTPAAAWVELERAKCDTGGMCSYLLELDGSIVGAISAVRVPGLLRMKNVETHPAHRRKGVGRAMLAHLAGLARAEGQAGVCIFAVEGEPGEKLYRSVGLQVIGIQVEWSRPLTS